MTGTSRSQPKPLPRQIQRQRAITEVVMAEGSVRIESLAERFGISLMTVHRDLDELESRGLLRKSRGLVSARASSLVESSDVYRIGQQRTEKRALAQAAMEFIEPGQSILLDDSTTVQQMAKLLPSKVPLTIITNVLTLMNELNGVRDISLVGVGGNYYNWCSAFMGRITNEVIAKMSPDVFIMSTAAITHDVCFHQSIETVDTKRAMFDVARQRVLLADHTKFEKRALHAMAHLNEFDVVIVDAQTAKEHITRLQSQGIRVVVAGLTHISGPRVSQA